MFKACDIDGFTATAKLVLYNFTNFQICCCHDYQWKCWSEPRAHLFTFLASRSSWRSSNSDDGACERNGKAWCKGFACHARLCDGQETRTTPFWGNHWCWACDTSDPKNTHLPQEYVHATVFWESPDTRRCNPQVWAWFGACNTRSIPSSVGKPHVCWVMFLWSYLFTLMSHR